MLAVARDAQRRVAAADHEAAQAKDAYARRCLELHTSGLSLAQVAVGLGISRGEAQRLIQRVRELDPHD